MALIKCPECGKKVSNKAKSCINCGIKLKNNYLLFALIVLLICIGIVLWLASYSKKLIEYDNQFSSNSKAQQLDSLEPKPNKEIDYKVSDIGSWKVSRFKNPNNGVTSKSVSIMSETKILWPDEDFGRGAIFSIQESSVTGRAVIINLLGDEPFCLRDTCSVVVKFDAGAERVLVAFKRYDESSRSAWLEIQSDGEVETLIGKANVMRVNAEYQESGQLEFVFNVMNFDIDKYLNR
jgi:hypothetical protein